MSVASNTFLLRIYLLFKRMKIKGSLQPVKHNLNVNGQMSSELKLDSQVQLHYIYTCA